MTGSFLRDYYEPELRYLRKLGEEFAGRYPHVAQQLLISRDRCDDPHVERLLEGFAFLTARIHQRLDDEFPEITGALLDQLYPYFLRPTPSVAMIEFQTNREGMQARIPALIPRGTAVATQPSDGDPCKFRTCYDVRLAPMAIEGAACIPAGRQSLGLSGSAAFAIRVDLACSPGIRFGEIPLDRLRLYLHGDASLAYRLHEVLLTCCRTAVLEDEEGRIAEIERDPLLPVGFHENEGLFWKPRAGFAGYQILEDYFAFPQKFLFLDLNLKGMRDKEKLGRRVSLYLLFPEFRQDDWKSDINEHVKEQPFRLNCTPAVNQFPESVHIHCDPAQSEYLLQLKPHQDIYSVDECRSAEKGERFDRFIDCSANRQGEPTGYWTVSRRAPGQIEKRSGEGSGESGREDFGSFATEVYLSLVNRKGGPIHSESTLTVSVTCTDGELPWKQSLKHSGPTYQIHNHPEVQKTVSIISPRPPVRVASPKASLWRLITQLSLNHLSLLDRGALQDILRVHNLSDSEKGARHIDSIVSVASRAATAPVYSSDGMALVRGKDIEVEIDESEFPGQSAFLFGCVLERFFGLYASINSFSRLKLTGTKRSVMQWPARAGVREVL